MPFLAESLNAIMWDLFCPLPGDSQCSRGSCSSTWILKQRRHGTEPSSVSADMQHVQVKSIVFQTAEILWVFVVVIVTEFSESSWIQMPSRVLSGETEGIEFPLTKMGRQ